jgi:protease-4
MNFVRESVFVSAVRSFCTCFAALLGFSVALIAIILVIALFSNTVTSPDKSTLVVAADANGKREVLPESAPVILRINFHGQIGVGDLSADKIENLLLDSREDLLENNRVKAVLLHMNTPGGLATDSDIIYRALMNYKKKYNVPIYAYVDGICASGGVYITSAADKIYADASSIIGSVGVLLGPTFNVSEVMGKVGVQSLTLTEGKDKDMLNPFRPWKEGEDQSLRTVMAALYERFVDIVAKARPQLSKEKLRNEYGAQVYVAPEAQRLGYIDEGDAEYHTALADLVKAAGIDEKTSYQVVQLKVPFGVLSALVQGKSPLLTGKITHTFQWGAHQNSEMSGKFLYLYNPNG